MPRVERLTDYHVAGLGEEERVKGDDVYHLLRKERVSEYFKPNHYSISLALCLSHVEIVDFLLR
jgi:hypothetical protein